MELTIITQLLSAVAYGLVVFSLAALVAIFKGRQALANITCGMYFGLLLFTFFPYTSNITEQFATEYGKAWGLILIFIVLTSLLTVLSYRFFPDEFSEKTYESLGKKVLLAIGTTVLVLAISFHVLEIEAVLSGNVPLESIFSPAEYFFWWLMTPLVILYFSL